MRIDLHDVAIGEGPGADLPPITVSADQGEPGFVAVETENAPTVASLVAGGRMAADHGRVLIDGRDDAAAIRASFALVDTPGVAEPFGSLTVTQVAREELVLAGLRSDRASIADLLGSIGLDEHRRTRLHALPTDLRVRLLCELAVLRPEVRGIVLTTPERHGGDVAAWLAVVHDLVARDYTVLVVTSYAALALATSAAEPLPEPEPKVEPAPAPAPILSDGDPAGPVSDSDTPDATAAVAPSTPESDRS